MNNNYIINKIANRLILENNNRNLDYKTILSNIIIETYYTTGLNIDDIIIPITNIFDEEYKNLNLNLTNSFTKDYNKLNHFLSNIKITKPDLYNNFIVYINNLYIAKFLSTSNNIIINDNIRTFNSIIHYDIIKLIIYLKIKRITNINNINSNNIHFFNFNPHPHLCTKFHMNSYL